MPELIKSDSELKAYLLLLERIEQKGERSSRYLELLNSIVSMEFKKINFDDFLENKDYLINAIGETAFLSFKRAIRVFEEEVDRVTKPSYRKRLIGYEEIFNGSTISINQLERIIYELTEKPLSSTLSFSFFRPIDNIKKQRQGYVPCPLTGDFKFRKNKLHLSIFFRSQDALNFFIPDVYYFRQLQFEILESVKKKDVKDKFSKAEIGSLNFHYSRVYLPLSMEWKPKQYKNKPEMMSIINKLKNAIIDVTQDSS